MLEYLNLKNCRETACFRTAVFLQIDFQITFVGTLQLVLDLMNLIPPRAPKIK